MQSCQIGTQASFHLLLSHISLTHNLVPEAALAGAATMMNFKLFSNYCRNESHYCYNRAGCLMKKRMARGSMESATTSPVCWTTSDLEIFEGDRVNRYEIIDGELLDQSTRLKHQAVCINIGTMLKLWSDESGLGQPAVTLASFFRIR